MAVPVAAAVTRPKWGPGSRGSTAGRRKASDVLAERKAPTAASAGTSEPPKPPAGPPMPAGGFGQGLRDGASQGRNLGPRSGAANDGAGMLLGFLVWVWVVLPYISGGPSRVTAVLKAKTLNKGPDGSELP